MTRGRRMRPVCRLGHQSVRSAPIGRVLIAATAAAAADSAIATSGSCLSVPCFQRSLQAGFPLQRCPENL